MRFPVSSADDDLVFLKEYAPPAVPAAPAPVATWRVMIVDDDADVHNATTFALRNLEFQQRPLEFLHAYSATEARQLLQQEANIAIILLDVVMEQDDSGLQLVRHIREVLNLDEVRIILRTGQPGYAPEIEAIRDFDINDYKTKSELTRIKLYTTVTAAIRSYQQIRAINAGRRGLDNIIRASTELMAARGLDHLASGVIAQVGQVLDLPAQGLFCARDRSNDPESAPRIIAATDSLACLRNDLLPGQRIAAPLAETFSRRRNCYGPDYATLYLGAHENRDFAVFFDSGKPLSEIDQRLLDVFCRNITVGLDNVLLVTRLHRAAFHDPLTGLPNRTRLKELPDDAPGDAEGEPGTITFAPVKIGRDCTLGSQTSVGPGTDLPDGGVVKVSKVVVARWLVLME